MEQDREDGGRTGNRGAGSGSRDSAGGESGLAERFNHLKQEQDAFHGLRRPTYDGMFLSRKNEITPFAAMWTDLEMIILSEASQTEKDQHHVISLHVEPKNVIQVNIFTKQQQTFNRHRKQTYCSQGRREEGYAWNYQIKEKMHCNSSSLWASMSSLLMGCYAFSSLLLVTYDQNPRGCHQDRRGLGSMSFSHRSSCVEHDSDMFLLGLFCTLICAPAFEFVETKKSNSET